MNEFYTLYNEVINNASKLLQTSKEELHVLDGNKTIVEKISNFKGLDDILKVVLRKG